MRPFLDDLGLLPWGLVLGLGLLLGGGRWAAGAHLPCTHTAAPSGTGSACTAEAPCTVGTFLSGHAKPNTVLCLTEGVYRGDSGMLTLTPAHVGTPDHPITVRAVRDGTVLIDGQFGRRPLDCNGHYLTVEGVDLANGNDTTLVLRGSHCTVKRVVAWANAPADGAIENVIDIGGSHNLIEDFGAFGYARKTLAMGARGGSGPNVARRGWVEHNGSPRGSAQGNPGESAEIGYNQDNVTMENIFARRNIFSSTSEPEAAFHAFSTRNSALLGSMGYVTSEDHYDTSMLLNITPEAGSHAGSGHVTTNMLVQDVLLWAHSSKGNVDGFIIDGGQGSAGNRARNILAVAPPGGGRCAGSGWDCSGISKGTTLAEALAGRPLWEVAPGVCKRVVNRQVTSESLWPFPMRERIIAALMLARQPTGPISYHAAKPLDVIEAACTGQPLPPVVEPPVPPLLPPVEPPIPPPAVHPPLRCQGTLGAQGVLDLTCVPLLTTG